MLQDLITRLQQNVRLILSTVSTYSHEVNLPPCPDHWSMLYLLLTCTLPLFRIIPQCFYVS